MCGIGGIVQLDRRKVFNEETQLDSVSLLKHMQDRGHCAWGVYIEKKSGNHHIDCGVRDVSIPGELYKMPESVDKFLDGKQGVMYLDGTHTMLMHTRQHTDGDPFININNHPFNTPNFILAHNGVISNNVEILKKHGIKTEIECDSYVIIACIQKYYDDGLSVKDAIIKMSEEVSGGYACWLYHKDKKKLYLFRNSSNPIKFYRDDDKGLFMFASENDYIIDTYNDDKKVNLTDLKSLEYDVIYELNKDGITSVGKLKSPPVRTTEYTSDRRCNNRSAYNFNTNSDLSMIDTSLKGLYRLFIQYDGVVGKIQTIIGIISNEVVLLVSNNALIQLLDKTDFLQHKEKSSYDSEYTKYRISPKEDINKLTRALLKHSSNENLLPAAEIPQMDDSTFHRSLKELAETLGLKYKFVNGHYYFHPQGTKVPEEAVKLFNKCGFEFGKKRIKIRDNKDNRSKLLIILKGMEFIDGKED